MPVSVRNCSGTLCGSVVTIGLRRSRRSVSSKVPAPVPPSGWCVNACHDSSHQRHRLLELALRNRVELELIWLETGFVKSLQRRPAKTRQTTSPASASDERGDRGSPVDAPPRLRPDRAPGLEPREAVRRRERRALHPEQDEQEDPAVVDADGVRLAVLRDPRQRERDAEDRSSGSGSEREDDEALDALAVEHEPGHRREARERDAHARVREQQDDGRREEQHGARCAERCPACARRGQPERERHRDVAEERELVPVADGSPQPGEPPVVGVERGHALREERPAEDELRAARRRRPRRAPSRGTKAESRKPSSAKAA